MNLIANLSYFRIALRTKNVLIAYKFQNLFVFNIFRKTKIMVFRKNKKKNSLNSSRI